MPKRDLPKMSFGSGELAEQFHMRRDVQNLYSDGAKRMRNVRAIDSGSFERHPGSRWLVTLANNGVLISFEFNSNQIYVFHFYEGNMDAYLLDGTPAGSITGAPWTQDILNELRWSRDGDVLFLTHRQMRTQKIKRTGANTWSLSDYEFDGGIGGAIDQPYYKLADSQMTLAPSALTGSITLTTSDDFFVSDHVGTRLRYMEREIEITAITNGTTATGTVIQTLPPTQRITVSSTSVFQVGHTVEGSTDGIKGSVTKIVSSTVVEVIITNGITGFTASGNLISPDGKSPISSVTAAPAPAAIKDWEEQLCNDVNGYFGAIAVHRGRLAFADHESLPDALLMSRVGNYFNFSLGTASDGDAIFEFIGDGNVTRVHDLISAATLIITTNNGTYFIPERTDPPFTPTAISIRNIDNVQAGTARAIKFENRVIFSDASGSRMNDVLPSSNEGMPWESRNIAIYSPHLIRNPISAASAEKFLGYSERYAYIVNEDGTMAILHSIEDQSVHGFTLRETDGLYKSVAAAGNNIFTICERIVAGSTIYTLECFDKNLRLDAVKEIDDLNDVSMDYAGHDVYVTGGEYSYGSVIADIDGSIEIDAIFSGPFQLGFFFTPDVQTLTPEISGDGIATIAAKVKRITTAYIHVVSSGRYFVNGKPNSLYRVGDDISQPPPLRTEIRKVRQLGRSREPNLRFHQEDALPLKIIGITTEVFY